MNNKLINNKNIIFMALLVLILFLLKFELLSTPFFYEEKPYTITTAYNFSFWEIITHQYSRSAFADHHTLLPLSFFVLLKPFGYTPFSVHFLMLVFSSLGILFFIKSLQSLVPTKKNLYWFAPLLLLTYPDYFVHMSNYRYDIFAANIAIFSLWARLTGHFKLFVLASLLLSQTRETVIAFLASYILIDLFYFIKNKDKSYLKYILTSCFASLMWLSLFIANYFNYGRFSSSPASSQVNKSLAAYFKILKFDIKWFFFSDFRWILTLLTSIIIIYLWKKKSQINHKIFYLILPIFFYCFGMAFHVFKAVYYLYPTIYFLYGIYAYFLLKIEIKLYAYVGIIPILIFYFSHLNQKKGQELLKEDSTNYVQVVNNYKKIAKYIQKNIPFAKINAEWPIVYYFQDPMYGYVNKPIRGIKHRFADVWASILGHEMKDQIKCEDFRNDFEYVITIRHGNNFHREHQEFYIKKCEYEEVKHIGNNDTFGKVYKRI